MNSKTTLKTVVESSKDFDAFAWAFTNFLDEFYSRPDSSLLADEPRLVKNAIEKGDVIDAYVAAAAEALSWQFRFSIPKWIDGQDRICQKPFFTMHSPAGRAFVLAHTPTPFKSRQLFVGPEPLSRV